MKTQLSFAQNFALFCVTAISLSYSLPHNAVAQRILPTASTPCWKQYACAVFPFPRLQSPLPPLEKDMPYDVMMSYIFYENLARKIKYPAVAAQYNRLAYSDTLRYAMKYCYTMVDYNPVLFEQFQEYNDGQTRYASYKSRIFSLLCENILAISPYPFVETLLCQSSIIVHIRVADTVTLINRRQSTPYAMATVTATVLDTIKGRVLPPCNNLYPIETRWADNPPDYSSACLQFSYPLDWQRIAFRSKTVHTEDTMVDKNGVPWVQKDKEYIVFLSFGKLCSDSSSTYHDIVPSSIRSSSNNIYRIVDGNVLDPDNDFGLGTTPTVETFKNALRQKIYAITHFGE